MHEPVLLGIDYCHDNGKHGTDDHDKKGFAQKGRWAVSRFGQGSQEPETDAEIDDGGIGEPVAAVPDPLIGRGVAATFLIIKVEGNGQTANGDCGGNKMEVAGNQGS
jgi:hypothetical protein